LKEGVAGKLIRTVEKEALDLSVSECGHKKSKKQLDILLKLKVESWTTCLTKSSTRNSEATSADLQTILD
jgi:hypothetical protein